MKSALLAVLLSGMAQDKRLEDQALDRINAHRKAAGLKPVAIDPALSKGCTAHAKYLVRNADAPSAQGLGAHDEDPDLPGYTPEGKKAGQSSDIAFQSPPESVEGWMNSLFHRPPILDPLLKKVGLGYAEGGKWGWVCVLDVLGGVGSGRPEGPVVYPADKQQNVPLEFTGEIPNPIPQDKDDAGYPITVTFAEGVQVRKVEAQLKDEAGEKVECWMSTPEKPADERYQRNTICLIAKDPLRAGVVYTVSVSAKVANKAWTKSWTFKTAGE